MQSQNLYISLGIVILLVGITSFIARRMFDSNVDPEAGDDPSTRSSEFTFQQFVEESTLEHLEAPSMISVRENRSDDRIVARVLLYSISSGVGKP